MKRALLIINPISGTRDKQHLAAQTRMALGPVGYKLDWAETAGAGHAYAMALSATAENFDLVIAAGGDGTVNEVAQALCNTQTVLGIVPCGSGNGLARTLNIPQDFRRALDIIARGHVITADHGQANKLPFFCTFGVGFDAVVSERFANEKRRGRLSYVRSAFIEYINYAPKPYAIAVNGTVLTEEAFLIAVCNTSQYGNNAYIAPRASVSDGLLDVTVVHTGNPFNQALAGVSLLTGHIDRNTLIDTFRISAATITRLEPGPAQLDGEPLHLGRSIHVECCPASLHIAVPEGDLRFRPIVSPLRSLINDIRYDLMHLITGQ